MTKTYPVLGHSMRFLLEPGDSALALPCQAGELRAGEVALLNQVCQSRQFDAMERARYEAG